MNKKPRIVLFQFVSFFLWFSIHSYTPNLTPYAATLGASLTLMGVVASMYGLAQFLLRMPMGILSDLLRKRKLFVILGMVAALAGALILGLSNTIPLLITGRILTGVAAATWVITSVLYASYFDASQAIKSMSVLNASNHMGQVIGVLLGSYVAQNISYNAMFFVTAGGAFAGLIVSFFITENVPEERTPFCFKRFKGVVSTKPLLYIAVIQLLFQINVMSTLNGFSPILAQRLGASPIECGWLSIIATALAVFGTILVGTRFLTWVGEVRYIVCSAVIVGGLTALLNYSPTLGMLYALQGICGLAMGSMIALLQALSMRGVERENRATAMGAYQAIYGIGLFIGPLITGAISDHFGMAAGYFLVSILTFCVIPLALLWKREAAKIPADLGL